MDGGLVLASETEIVQILDDQLKGHQIKDSSKKWIWRGKWKKTAKTCQKGFGTNF